LLEGPEGVFQRVSFPPMPSTPEQEPSIEEILASIRQIISDDDAESAPEEAPAAPPPAPPPAAAKKAEAPPSPPPPPAPKNDDILELTDRIEDDADEQPVKAAPRKPEPEPEPAPVFKAEPPTPPPPPKQEAKSMDESILSRTAASAALQGFSKLTNNMAIEQSTHPAGITLEDVLRDMLRPMLREWLDANLPSMIEKLVEKELEKLARQARND
jgi:cell pole-organizing protein PopZ